MRRIVSTKNAEGFTRRTVYDGEGNVVKAFDPLNHPTTNEYDGLNRLRKQTDAKMRVTEFKYDNLGNRTEIIDPRINLATGNHYKTRMFFDEVNRMYKTIDPEDGVTQMLEFDLLDHVIRLKNARQFELTWHYDDSGRLSYSTDQAQRQTTYFYDQAGNLTKVVDPRGSDSRTEYRYDKLNRRVEQVVAPDSLLRIATTNAYNALGLVERTVVTTADGPIETRMEYDNLKYLKSVTAAFGTIDAVTTKYLRDFVGNLKSQTDPRGDFYTTTYDYDKINRLIEVTGPTGTPNVPGPKYHIFYKYDGADNLISQSDPRDETIVTRHFYDELNQRFKTTDAENHDWFMSYDEVGNLKTKTDPRGADYKTTYVYDGKNRLREKIDAYGHKERWIYDENNNLIDHYSPEDRRTQYHYDRLDRRDYMINGEGKQSYWKYNDADLVETRTDERSYVTTYKYDELNRLKSVEQQDGPLGGLTITTFYTYDARGNLRLVIDPRGSNYRTEYVYDKLDRLREVHQNLVDGDGGVIAFYRTKYEYDKAGNKISETSPRGDFFTTTWDYEARNLVLQMTRQVGVPGSPEFAITIYGYDLAGNMTTLTDPRGPHYTTIYTYDNLNRVETVDAPQGNPVDFKPTARETRFYDDAGNLHRVVSPRLKPGSGNYETVYEHDRLNRLITATDPEDNVTEYFYDDDGNLTKQIMHSVTVGVPDRQITYDVYDGMNRLRQTTNAEGMVTLMDYDDTGNLLTVRGPLANASGLLYTMSQKIDAQGRVYERMDVGGYLTIYEYDAVGNVKALTDGRGPHYRIRYFYDSLNRLVRTERPSGTPAVSGPTIVDRYAHDEAGNVIEHVDPRGIAFRSTYVFDGGNRLRSATVIGGEVNSLRPQTDIYEYDLAGNMIRHVDARDASAHNAFYATTATYDAQNRMLTRTMQAGYAGISRLLTEKWEYDEAGNLITHVGTGGPNYTTRYTYNGLNQRVTARNPENQLFTYVHDRYGNLRSVTDPYGTTSQTFDDLNRLRSTRNATGDITRIDYLANRTVATHIDGRGNPTRMVYDGLGRLLSETDAMGHTASYVYDAVGNRIRMIDKRGTESRYTYDARDLLMDVTEAVGYPEQRSMSRQYDDMGWLIGEIPWRGADYRIAYTRDNLGRVIEKRTRLDGTASEVTEHSTYDVLGNVTSQTDGRGNPFTTTFAYDGLNRLVETRRHVSGAGSRRCSRLSDASMTTPEI